MTKKLNQIITWVLVSISGSGNLFLLYYATTLPLWQRSEWPAQGDLELFIYLVIIGIPVVSVSVILIILDWRKIKSHKQALPAKGVRICSWMNMFIAIGLCVLLFTLKKYG